MRLTTRTRYAIRALYDLAFHRLGQAAGAKEIAERQKVPLRFLEQILQDLRKAGIVEARRGPRGGYALARSPGEISLAEVLHASAVRSKEMFGFDPPPAGSGRRAGGRLDGRARAARRRARARDAAGFRGRARRRRA
jgi:Rrf2 family protein